ncbi:MAG TPA: FAD-dependent oxidoreductase, partial [Acidimicrobiales bacterium]|nr:FAD-dependent oxidoreductase [Acidimicrobiales bacterium]
MTDERAGVVIVGAGLLGLAAAASLTGRGREVVVLEQAAIGHRRSGSQGSSRIFRLGYADPLYVEMARLARGRWQELEAFAGVDLLLPWPQLSFGADLRPLHDALEAAGSRVEWMNAEAVARRFPGFRPRGDALYEPDSGVLLADRCLAALARAATDGGAEIREGVAVSMIDDDGAGVTVTTSAGVIRADVAVVCGGAWSGALVASVAPEASVDFAPTLEHVVYAAPTSGTSLESLPIF